MTVAAVARRLGVAPATLRTWDRRYGLGPGSHQTGSHRRYTAADVRRLETMRRLVAAGVSPADAASAALAGGPAEEEETAPSPPVSGVRQDPDLVRGLSRAAQSLDVETVTAVVTDQLALHGTVATWEQLLVPVLVAAGARWATTGEGVDVEHLLSQGVMAALQRHRAAAPQPPRPVLLACCPGEQHELPLHALAAALAEQGCASRLLGAAVPVDALHAAVRRTGAGVVVVWSQLAATADPAALDVPVTRPRTAVVAAGPGWPLPLPPGVGHAGSLGAATALVSRALRGKPIASAG